MTTVVQRTAPPDAERALAELSEAVAARLGVPAALLDGYPEALLAVARTGRRLSLEEQASCRRLGEQAVGMGVGLPTMVDLHMQASRRLWSRLPELLGASRGRAVRGGELLGIGEAVWRAADAALGAVTAGYLEAQQSVVRQEEEEWREFVDDLLTGRSGVAASIERGEHFGLQLAAGRHVVVVVECDRAVNAGSGIRRIVEDAARTHLGNRGLLVAAKEGRVVCVAARSPESGSTEHLGTQVAQLAGPLTARTVGGRGWRVGVGRPHAGPLGVQRSYQEALGALDTAARLALPQRVVHAADLLVYRVLGRDETALAELVGAVLGPLTHARGGAEPLIETLDAYFAAGGNATEAARRLHLSVRAVTYRLQRVQELTGYAAGDPSDRLSLLVAVTGARLLDWPRRALVTG
ncbi:PucR C-terminal helix-turn-helix domain-containing protein [Geodermatophilus dictyosporus]|uniref:PucR C-terminal helix-turn-helix domain-containing protein n=1 Tax=Geodermatophilus dictyosporus TaxID=1523247 RepID=A0A1I5JUM0_9ACTN|nr:helix-turn-helix domain-containing protein [Geodermatophilus dictyosporus]SFO76026.1 PucR C-terminal helix-turn-helix domain-containing protein [Geodermatophilus dictyosporus]